MNVALILAFLFNIGSLFGWVLELFFRRILWKKWINPGFLTGPYLPLYGLGLCMLFLLSLVDISVVQNDILRNLIIIVFMGIMLTFIEYITGLIFVKGLKVKLWDYSQMWGNIQGIICPLYTFFWCILGGIYYFFIQSYMVQAIIWLSNNLAFSFLIGFFFGILAVDISNSMNIVVRLKKFAQENEIVVRFEELKNHIREEQEKRKEKINYLFAFKTNRKWIDTLNEYKNKYFSKDKTKEEVIGMKNQKGITLTILVMMVVIILIIAGSISYNSTNSYRMNTYYNMCSDIELLDEKIAIYYLEHKNDRDELTRLPRYDDSENVSITSLIPGYSQNNINYNPNNSGTLYKIDIKKLDNLSLNFEDYYIDSQSHTIYSATGITLSETKYYTVPMDYDDVNT